MFGQMRGVSEQYGDINLRERKLPKKLKIGW